MQAEARNTMTAGLGAAHAWHKDGMRLRTGRRDRDLQLLADVALLFVLILVFALTVALTGNPQNAMVVSVFTTVAVLSCAALNKYLRSFRVDRFVIACLTASACLLGLLVGVDVLRHRPHLQDVVLRHRRDHPRVVGVPRKVGHLGRVPAVDEEQLGRAVLRVVGRLLLADLAQVPHVESPVRAGRREDGLVEG